MAMPPPNLRADGALSAVGEISQQNAVGPALATVLASHTTISGAAFTGPLSPGRW